MACMACIPRLQASRLRSILFSARQGKSPPVNLPAPEFPITPVHVVLSRRGTRLSPLPPDADGTWAGKDAASPARSSPDEFTRHHCTPGPITNCAIQLPVAAQYGTSRFNNDLAPDYPSSYFSGRNPPLISSGLATVSRCAFSQPG
jgi:hypothetical protein